MTKEILIKYLNNQCSDAELQEVIRWAKTDALNKKSRNWAANDWRNYSEEEISESDERFSTLFDKIQSKINTDNQNLRSNSISHSGFSIAFTWLTRVAAVLLIPVLTFLFFTLSEKQNLQQSYATHAVDSLEVIAPIGSRTTVYLSDGSVVDLNYGSNLKYPQVFSGQSRKVTLSGEGYFKVAHKPEQPFIVKTGKLNVKAVGTSFNVSAYPGNDVVATTLIEGKVLLEENTVNGTIKTIGAMEPGQHVKYNTLTSNVSCAKGNTEKYIAWKDGKLVFEDASISEVATQLSRMFNVEIEVNENIKDYIYTVTLVDEPLFQILDLMTIATPVCYKALPRKKLNDGTFSKQKIVISKKG